MTNAEGSLGGLFYDVTAGSAVFRPEVQEVQKKLNIFKELSGRDHFIDLGAYGPEGDGVDGKLGPKTDAAIKHVQQALGMEETGVISQEFIEKLDGWIANPEPGSLYAIDVPKPEQLYYEGGQPIEYNVHTEQLQRNMIEYADGHDDVQINLGNSGYFKNGVDGLYGKLTQGAVITVQDSLGLEATGVADDTLFTALDKALESANAPESVVVAANLDPASTL